MTRPHLPPPLDVLLAPAFARWRRLGVLEAWALTAVAGLVLAVGLSFATDALGWYGPVPWLVLLSALLVTGALGHRRARRRLPEPRAIAAALERSEPELQGLLLTAVEQRPTGTEAGLGYLQEELVRQALARVKPELTERAVSRRRMRGTTACAAIAGGMCLTILTAGIWPNWPSLFPDRYGLTVAPGHTEAEVGTQVVVTARFDERVPSRAVLVVLTPGRPPVNIEMTKNLDDPVFGALTPPLAGPEVRYQIEYEGHRSRRFSIRGFQHPDLERLDARIEYPRVAGRAPQAIEDTRHLSVLEGARVTLSLRLSERVKTATFTAEKGAPAPPRLVAEGGAPSDLWRGVLDADRSRRFELHLVDEGGRNEKAPIAVTIEVHRDLPASVTMVFPGRDHRVSPLEELTIEAKVRDDLGLLAWGLTYRLGKESRTVRLGGPASGNQEQVVRATLALEDLKAQPRQVLVYSVWAEDAGPDGKPRRSSGDLYFAEVRPFEERFREAPSGGEPAAAQQRQRGGRQGGDLAEQQREVMNATWRVQRDTALRLSEDSSDVTASDTTVVRDGQAAVRAAAEARRGLAEGEAASILGRATEAMKQAEAHLDKAGKEPSAFVAALEAEQEAYAALLKLEQDEHQVTRGQRGGGGQGGRRGEQSQALSGLELKQKESRYESRSEAAGGQAEDPERREISSRLQELARRQRALTERIREAQAALEADKQRDEEERRRELKRLRDEQREVLAELDQVAQRMDGARDRKGLDQARSELARSRAEAQQTSEALAQGETPKALGASRRAEQGLDRVDKNLRAESAAAFSDEMRELRERARRLDEEQRQIGEALAKAGQRPAEASPEASLEQRRLTDAMTRQRKEAGEVLERMQQLSDAAELPAPLLARKLYDSLRRARTGNLEPALARAAEAMARNFHEDTQRSEAQARAGLAELRHGVDEAARGVLRDESEALRLARADLDKLIEEARREPSGGRGATAQTGAPGAPGPQGQGQGQQGQPGQQAQQGQQGQQAQQGQQGQQAQQGQQGQAQRGQPGQPGQQAQQGQPGQGQRGGQGQPGGQGQRGGQGQPGGQGQGQRGGTGATGVAQGGGESGPGGNEGPVAPGSAPSPGPITGDGYRTWAERLRDVEQALEDARLRQAAARVQDRARALRADFKRHGRVPDADLFQAQVLNPLLELREQVSDELRRASGDDKLGPVDRDPVPPRYGELVRRYYRSLAEGQ